MSWKKYKLGTICENLDGKRKPLNNIERGIIRGEGKYPYFGANNIMDWVDEYIFDGKILCLAEDGGSWGANEKCSFIFSGKCWVNNHAHVLRAKDDVILEFLMYYLNHSNLNSYITGSTRGKLTKSSLNEIQIPLPDLQTQKHIASILDKADALRQQNRQLLAHYDALLQSTFIEMFGDPVENPKGWEMKKIRDLVSEVKYGTSKPAEDFGSFKYLRMNNLTYDGFWDFSSLKYINLENNEISKYVIRKGDIVFNRTNSKELVGKTAVYNLDEPVVIAGYLIRVRTNENAIPEYIWAYLNSKHGKATLQNMCKSIVGMANINAQELQEIDIFLPDILLQTQFAEIVKAIEAQKEQVKSSLAESEALFQGLLSNYFWDN